MNLSMELKDKSILITGGTGLIGSEIVSRLITIGEAAGEAMNLTLLVRDLSRATERLNKIIESCNLVQVTLLEGDVCDNTVLTQYNFDYIIHCAGNSHPIAFSKYPVETMKANLMGTMNLLEYVRSQNEKNTPVARMVFLSSGEVYGNAPLTSDKGWTEDAAGIVDSMNPRSCYPESKRAAETLCRSYFEEYQVPVVVARLGYIYGAGITADNSRADAQFLWKASAGEPIVMKSKGEQLRSYCYVKDAADAILLLLTKGHDGEAYNVADPNSIRTIREYAQCLADTFDVSVVFELPDAVEKAGYSQMKKEILNPDKLISLGWSPAYSMQEAMEEMRVPVECE